MTPSEYQRLKQAALAGILTPEETARLDAWHAEHPEAAAQFAKEGDLLNMAFPARPEHDDAYWDEFYQGVLAREAATPPNGYARLWEHLKHTLNASIGSVLAPIPRPVLQFSIAVLLVGLGVVLGRNVFNEGTTTPMQLNQIEGLQPASAEVDAWDYIDRSKVLLLGIVNAEDPAIMNLEHKQAIAGTLVEQAPGLQKALSEADQARLAQLVGDLEVLLLQIANLEAQYDAPGIELVQHGVERQGILLKISLEEMRRRDAAARSVQEQTPNFLDDI